MYHLCIMHMQVDADTCADKYKLAKRQVQELQENAGHFAAKAVAFCERMGYAALKAVLAVFQVGRRPCCVMP